MGESGEEGPVVGLDRVCATPGYLIRRAHQLATAAYVAEFGAEAVTGVQFIALNAIIEEPGLTGVTVAERIGYDKMTTSQLIRRLEKKGLVTRSPSKTDGREIQLWPTDEARRVVGAIGAGMNRVADSLLAPLAPAERREFLALLKKLEDHARKAT